MENTPTPITDFNQTESALQTPKTNYLNLILISLAFVLFISGAYFLGKQSSVIPVYTPVAVLPKTTAIPTAATDPTANWKTYTNTSLEIQFNHPSSWTIRGFAGDQDNFDKTESTYTRFVIESPDDSLSLTATNNIFEGAQDPCMSEIKPSVNQTINGIIFSKSVFISHCPESDAKFISLSSSMKKISLVFNYSKTNQVESEKTLDQILSTFKFTESKEEDQFKLGNSFFYLNFPSDSIINKNNVTISNSIFNIDTFVGSGLCPMDETEAAVESCTYTDQPGSKWSTYRVWTKNSKPFAINPQSIILNNKYFDGMIITKSKPNEFFTQNELSQWKDILNKINYSEQ